MSTQAEELLDSLSEDDVAVGTPIGGEARHAVIGADRFISIPEELKRLSVQNDHNIETIVFDCPRYWQTKEGEVIPLDTHFDQIYINYMRPDGKKGYAVTENVAVDENDSNLIHFEWVITNHLTAVKGTIKFLVCAKCAGNDGSIIRHWNSEINSELYISEGMECDEETIVETNIDIITQLLNRMDNAESVVKPYTEQAKEYTEQAKEYAESAESYTNVAKGYAIGEGLVWTAGSTLYNNNYIGGVAYGNGVYVAVGSSGATYYSEDGVNWTKGNNDNSFILYDVAYGNGVFVAVGYKGIIYSSDGINWTIASIYAEEVEDIVYGGDKFVAGGHKGYAYYSTDGINWTSVYTSAYIDRMAYGNGVFVGISGLSNALVRYSIDGINWSSINSINVESDYSGTLTFSSIAYGDGKFICSVIASSSEGNTYMIAYSYNGADWTVIEIDAAIVAHNIAYGDGMFVAVQHEGYAYSNDGIVWSEICEIANDITSSPYTKCVAYENGKFFAMIYNSCIYYSEDVESAKKYYENAKNLVEEAKRILEEAKTIVTTKASTMVKTISIDINASMAANETIEQSIYLHDYFYDSNFAPVALLNYSVNYNGSVDSRIVLVSSIAGGRIDCNFTERVGQDDVVASVSVTLLYLEHENLL